MRKVLAANMASRLERRYKDLPNITARQRALAKDSGVAFSTVQRIMKTGTGATLESLESIANAFQSPVHELLLKPDATHIGPDLSSAEELLIEIFRGLFSLQQREEINNMRALFVANQVTRKELGQKPLRGVSNERIEAAFGKVPVQHKPRPKPKPAHRKPDERGAPIDDE